MELVSLVPPALSATSMLYSHRSASRLLVPECDHAACRWKHEVERATAAASLADCLTALVQ
jgi:hypothetical protein